ncbi:MAG: hypothetical protein ACOY3K_01185 [Candidatus Omnitrophota bacterium]
MKKEHRKLSSAKNKKTSLKAPWNKIEKAPKKEHDHAVVPSQRKELPTKIAKSGIAAMQ